MRKILTSISVCLKILCMICIFSAAAFGTELSPCTESKVHSVQNSMNSMKSFSTDFLEKTNEQIKTGKIYVKKPGMMKIDYKNPKSISILINKDIVTYYDHELDELTKIKQDPKFLTFLAKESLDFKNDFEGFECLCNDDETELKLSFTKQDDEKVDLQVNFLKQNLNSVAIYVNDRPRSFIAFKNFNSNNKIEDKEFIFKNKKFFEVDEK
jgi:outer membrane lipoprotein-sorting protein